MNEKPLCVECGSDKVISKGVSWLCKECGRWFLKKPRGNFRGRVFSKICESIREIKNKYVRQIKEGKIITPDFVECRTLGQEIQLKYNLSSKEVERMISTACELC